MSLYDDIVVGGTSTDLPSSSKSSTSAWSNNGIKLLQNHLQTKKRENHSAKRDAFGRRILTSNFSGASGFRSKPGDEVPPPVINIHGADSKASGSLLGGTWDVSQEYDPHWPNDYEKIIRERTEQKEKERAAERAKENALREKERRERAAVPTMTMTARPLVDDYSDDEDEEAEAKPVRPGGAAIAPPSSLIEHVAVGSSAKASNIASNVGVSFVAAKIMTKMGYKEGQGLGKEEQGMSRALEVEKTSMRGGKIVTGNQEPDAFVAPPPPLAPPSSTNAPPEAAEPITEIMKNPTKVVLLRNMVGPGEVDNDLEPEVKEECSKYGEVAGCVIFELPGTKAVPEEAVRIFVEFKRVESAIKAVVDLNGRFFGGRTVRAGFYDLVRFKKLDLVDSKQLLTA